MGITEVRSPASSSSRNSKLSGGQPLSPGARSMPGRGRADQAPPQAPHAHISLGGGDEPAELHVIGPTEE
jgi:hypothetical protein